MKKILFTLFTLFSSISLAVTEVTKDNFKQEVVNYEGLIVIKFYSDNCGACRKFEGVYQMSEAQFDKAVKFVQINVDNCPEIAINTGVESIPTVVFLINSNKRGKGLGATVGALSPAEFEQFMKDMLKKAKSVK